jgi:hypothetical protein
VPDQETRSFAPEGRHNGCDATQGAPSATLG